MLHECAHFVIQNDNPESYSNAAVKRKVADKTYLLRELGAPTQEITCPDGKKEQYKKADLDRCKLASLGKPQNCSVESP